MLFRSIDVVGMFVHELTSVQSGPTHGGPAQTFALPPAPQVWPGEHVPQVTTPPQPSETMPQFAPTSAQSCGVHTPLPLPSPLPPH